jgi:acetyltransferase-like isoleucine patch superfamily enzyme
MKQKIKLFIKNHSNLFNKITHFINRIQFKNKLHAKGCKVTMGLCKINGLKIVSHGTDNQVIIGNSVHIKDCVVVIYGNHNKVIIDHHVYMNQVTFHMEDDNNQIHIGENTNLCGKTHFAAIEGTNITIGKDCLFSSDLHFSTGDSHSILNLEGARINPSQDIMIEDHVWIGTKVTCLKGVRVSENSVVAATTTLCKNYDTPNVIIGGVPGKVIKSDINWAHERI